MASNVAGAMYSWTFILIDSPLLPASKSFHFRVTCGGATQPIPHGLLSAPNT